MKPIKCNNCKMFYDGDKYESCPHCKAATTEENEEKAVEKETSQRGVTGRRTEKKTTQKEPEKKVTEKKTTEKKTTEKKTEEEPPKKKKFGDIFKKKTKEEIEEEVVSEEIVEEPSEPKKTTKTEKGSSKKVSSKWIDEEEDEEEEVIDEEIEETEEDVDDEPEYDDDDEGETVAPGKTVPSIKDAVQRADSTANSADEKTVAFYNFSNAIEPVVGWIICVEGEYMGESFSLKSGRNNIGRSLAMDIALAKEKSVSRERHASITFEPNQKKFFIQSGESSGLTYVNNELIMTFAELKDYDVITLGQSRYVFLRLCGKKFSWDDYT